MSACVFCGREFDDLPEGEVCKSICQGIQIVYPLPAPSTDTHEGEGEG